MGHHFVMTRCEPSGHSGDSPHILLMYPCGFLWDDAGRQATGSEPAYPSGPHSQKQGVLLRQRVHQCHRVVILHRAGVSVFSTDAASQDSSPGFPSPIRYQMPAFCGECLSYPSGAPDSRFLPGHSNLKTSAAIGTGRDFRVPAPTHSVVSPTP